MDEVVLTAEEAKLLRGSKVLMDQLLKSPKTRRQAEKLVKELYPDTQTTDDLAAPYIERLSGLEEKLDKFFKKQEVDQIESKLDADLKYLRETEGYSEEGIEKVKELMVKEQIPNAIAAAAFWEKKNPPKPPEPAGFTPSTWGIGHKTEDADLKLLFDDEDAWAEKTAKAVWDEETRKSGRILT